MSELRNIIFLDLDGIVNSNEARRAGFCKTYGDKDFHFDSFDPKSKYWLNLLISRTDSDIVASTSWRKRGLDEMKKIWEIEEMNGKLIDTTPSLYLQKNGSIVFYNNYEKTKPTPKIRGYSIPRGCEIEYWLKNKNFSHINYSKEIQYEFMVKSGIRNYLIIDDDSDMLYSQRNNFLHVYPSPRNESGFNESHFIKGLEMLSKDLVQQNYG